VKFFEWAYTSGDQMADELDYVPMPDAVKKAVRAQWRRMTDASGKAIIQ
jgi:phosphate transport system substrate-binding protein